MTLKPQSFDASVLIGRFQPFHNGHLALVQRALELATHVFVVIGSAHTARTPRNPWTYGERADMLLGSLSAVDRARVTCLALRDYYDEPRWRDALVREVTTRFEKQDTRVALVGHFKDETSEYLRGFAGWHLDSAPLQGDVHATAIRERYLLATTTERGELLSKLAPSMPAHVVAWLQAFQDTAEYAELADELKHLRAYKQSWANAPFPPVFVTVDAVVVCRAHVLLIQRGHAPGKGLWALPGGFLEPAETTLQSSLRELLEETGLALTGERAQPQESAVFDHPQRSSRGRTITHVFQFCLPDDGVLPAVAASDDAGDCRWVPVEHLLAMESRLFEDHLLVLDRFLGLLPHPSAPTNRTLSMTGK
jgi:bifunctional NMN adenylyltransferase/nudix hydrolase